MGFCSKRARASSLQCLVALVIALSGNLTKSATLPDEYSKTVAAANSRSPISNGVFGESINRYSGATTFRITDVTLPATAGPAITISRSFDVSYRNILTGDHLVTRSGHFGDWDIEIPHISATLAKKTGTAWTANRCSGFAAPPMATGSFGSGIWDANEYWNGYFLNVSGADEEIVRGDFVWASSQYMPSNGLRTRSAWSIQCLASSQDANGEGFLAISPDGIKYYFNWYLEEKTEFISKPAGQGPIDALSSKNAQTVQSNSAGSGGGNSVLERVRASLRVTRVEDRFGNWIQYNYDASFRDRLVSITASDGRQVSLAYENAGRISQISVNGRSWLYSYTNGSLSQVTLPDQSAWTYNMAGVKNPYWSSTTTSTCDGNPAYSSGLFTAYMTGPSGITGQFSFQARRHARNSVPRQCVMNATGDTSAGEYAFVPKVFGQISLVSKTLSGPGIPNLTWQYDYETGEGSWLANCGGSCVATKWSTELDPNGVLNRQIYSNRYQGGEGRLISEEVVKDNQIVRKTDYQYLDDATGQLYPAVVGISEYERGDPTSQMLRPLRSRTITQDGTSFYLHNYSYDAFANPMTVGRWSSLGYSKTEVTEYHHDLNNWVLSQPYRTYNASNGVILSRTEYNTKAQPIQQFAFEKLQSTLTYNTDDTLATAKDGRNNTTTFSNWKRGIPQSISFADGTTKSAVVDDNGWVRSITDENGYITGYGYDAMGNVAAINYPQETNLTYHITTRIFEQVQFAEYGLAAGHWRERIETGNAKKITYYDALFRPVATQSEDITNSAGTFTWSMKRYDANGNVIAASYPKNPYQSGWNTIYDNLPGTRTQYDALDRSTRNEQDSELGVLATVTEYLAGFQVRTTNPRGYQTTNGYEVYDAPSYDALAWSAQPENKTVEITRNFAGLPLWIRQRAQDNSVSVMRNYVYDGNMQLCKTHEPETGATVNHYDAAGNVDWSASGLALPDVANCNLTEAQSSNRVVSRTYDTRNRLSALSFADGYGNQVWQYTPDGLPSQITTHNEPSSQGTVVNKYTYNHRRMLSGESIESPNAPILSAGYGFDSYGAMTAQSYPDSGVVIFTVNALGQVTGVSKSGTPLASNALYYPNGAIKQFTYGNGVVHTMTQNARQIPGRSADAGVMNLAMSYDANGNTTAIADDQQGTNFNRTMTYDGLDRLTDAGSPSFGGDGWHRIRYNALDNITSNQLAGVKDYANYVYDASNRLTQIKNTAQQSVVTLAYDPQGNLTQKNGQGFVFDLGNRLRSAVNKETYRYDGLGRRVENGSSSIGNIYSMYSRDGQLLHTVDHRRGERLSYIYLSGSQVARVRGPLAAPTAPTLTAPTSSMGGHFALTWTASMSADSYVLEQSTNGGAWALLYSGTATNAATGAMAAGTYSYRVKACNSIGCSAYSSEKSVEVITPPISAPALTVPANGYGGSYTVSWATVSGATRYELEENVNAGTWTNIVNSNTTSISRNNLPAGTYGYRVRACNAAGCSNYSGTASVSVLYAPSSAPALTVPANGYGGNYTVSWSAASGATRYELEENVNAGTWANIVNGNTTSATRNSLPAGTYGYRVRACNVAGCSNYSSTAFVNVLYAPTSAPALTVPGTVNTTSVSLSWSAVATSSRYEVLSSFNGGASTLAYNGAGTSTSFSGLSVGTYSYQVRACNAVGCGPYSSAGTTTVQLTPQTPVITGEGVRDTSTRPYRTSWFVSWTSVANATLYEVERTDGSVTALLYSGTATSAAYNGGAYAIYSFRVRACNGSNCSAWSSWFTPPVTGD